MTTIQLHIPDDLAKRIAKLTANTESYILELLNLRLRELDNNLPLAEQYRMASIENKEMAEEFIAVDLENWEDDF